MSRFAIQWVVCCFALVVSTVQAGDGIRPLQIEITLHKDVSLENNLIRLQNLCEISGSESLVQSLRDVPLGPAPRSGSTNTITRDDIEKVLRLRGVGPSTIRWHGAESAVVRKESKASYADSGVVSASHLAPVPSASNTSTNSASPDLKKNLPAPGQTKTQDTSVDKNGFMPAFSTPAVSTQSEGNAALAIERYLQTRTKTTSRWIVKPEIPTEFASILMQRANILSVGGGQAPWEGSQEFAFIVKNKGKESTIAIRAEVKLPEMILAAKGPLSKGRVLRHEDLVWIPIPPNANFTAEECSRDYESIVGKQLRKAVSTQQPIKGVDVGEPVVVQAGDMITLGVVSGLIYVETKARAVESGALDDVIQVETLHDKKRRVARVVGDRQVEIISNSAARSGG